MILMVTTLIYGSKRGMVEYISRKYFLTEEEFQAEKICNQSLVELFSEEVWLAFIE